MKNFVISAATAACLSSLIAMNASAKVEQYTLKGSAPSGSKIQSIEAVGKVPFNRSFKQLSKQQQQTVIDQYSEFSSNATPPFPADGLAALYQPLIAKNKQLRGDKTLRLVAMVNQNGLVDSVTVLSSTDPQLNRYAEDVFMRTRFDSAICDGQRCSMEFPLSLKFQ